MSTRALRLAARLFYARYQTALEEMEQIPKSSSRSESAKALRVRYHEHRRIAMALSDIGDVVISLDQLRTKLPSHMTQHGRMVVNTQLEQVRSLLVDEMIDMCHSVEPYWQDRKNRSINGKETHS